MRPMLVAAAAACMLAACAQVSDEALYKDSIKDAAWASPAKVVPLKALPDSGMVNVVSWTGTRDSLACADGATCAYPRAGSTRANDVTWVTLAPEVGERCKAWGLSGAALTRRLEQALGLPPGGKYARVFVEFQVPASALTRPCVAPTKDAEGRPVCNAALPVNWQQADKAQTFAALAMASSYSTDGGYPFTRMGYTYDWAPDARADHYGASEFVVAVATPATITRQASSDEYCR